MKRRPARDHEHLVHGADVLFREAKLVQREHVVGKRAAAQRVGNGVGLLVDLFQHERVVAGFLGRLGVPVDVDRVPFGRLAGQRRDREPVLADLDHLVVEHVHHVARVRDQRGRIRCEECGSVALPHDERARPLRRHDETGLLGRDDSDRKGAFNFAQRCANGCREVPAEVRFDQVGQRLRIGFASELVTVALEALPELEVVLDDPVVDQRDVAGAVGVWVRVLVGRAAVRCPARVPDASVAVERVRGQLLLERVELAGLAHHVDARAVEHGDSRRVVPAILDSTESVQDDGEGGLVADDADDAAHVMVSVSVNGLLVPWPNGQFVSRERR